MEKVNCSIIKDLLPLYADGVLSEETAQAVKDHLETCESCRKESEMMRKELVIPAPQKIQRENGKVLKNLKHQLKIKRMISAAIAAAVTAVIVISACMVYIHIGTVQDRFSEDTMVTLRDIQTDGEWKQLEFAESAYLNFDHPFCKKEITVDANSSGDVTLRISDADGNIVIDELTVQPGTSASLNELNSNTDYKVEIQADADFVLIRFH